MKRRRQADEEEKAPRRKTYTRTTSRPRSMAISRTGNVEKKFVDLNQVGLSLPGSASGTTSGAWRGFGGADTLCNGLAVGTTATSRTGRKIVMKSIYMRLTCYANALGSTQSGPVRLLVIYDKQTNGAYPTPAAADGAPIAYDHISSPNNIYAAGRYVTLFDQLMEPISGSSAPGCPSTRTIMAYRKINLPVLYNDNGNGTVADIQTGAVWCTLCSAGLSTTAVTFDLMTRIRFVDE